MSEPAPVPSNPLDTIEWDGPAETWTTPLTPEQVVRLTTCVAMVDDQMIAIVAFGPERPDCISTLPDPSYFHEGDPGDTWQVRFGRMPLAAYRDLPEHGGW